jgi:Cu+-exporting ATPase
MVTVELSITGMHCAACGITIDGAVEELAGVAESRTDIRRGRTKVTLDPQRVSLSHVAAAIEGAGYGASFDEVGMSPT